MDYIADGLENGEIAEKLQRGLGTIRIHVSKILNKLGARNRTHAVAIYIRAQVNAS